MSKTNCIYISELDAEKTDFSGFENVIRFPDKCKTYDTLMKIPRIENCTIVVSSPIICTNYKLGEVYVYENGSLNLLDKNIYGASLDIAIKILHKEIVSTMSSYIIDEIRTYLKTDNAIKHIESLADSGEKVYLLKVLEKESK